MYRVIGFDLDGTIADTIPMCLEAFRRTLISYAPHKMNDDSIYKTFGMNEVGMLKSLVGEDWSAALEDFYIHYEGCHKLCPPIPNGILDLIEKLKKMSVKVALITGKGERSCRITIDKLGLVGCFDHIMTGSEEGVVKKRQIEELLSIYDISKEEFVYVGDAVSDVVACREVGVKCLSAMWYKGPDYSQVLEINRSNVVTSVEVLCRMLI